MIESINGHLTFVRANYGKVIKLVSYNMREKYLNGTLVFNTSNSKGIAGLLEALCSAQYIKQLAIYDGAPLADNYPFLILKNTYEDGIKVNSFFEDPREICYN